jgi:cathepsin B
MRFVLLLACVAVAASLPLFDDAPVMTEELINEINSRNDVSWVAGWNSRFDGMTVFEAKRLMGVPADSKAYLPPAKDIQPAKAIPDSFDARTAWPKCNSIGHIRDQGPCGSCWAFGAVEAMSDRICISSGQTNQLELSAQDMVSCCDSCGDGCEGGYPSAAWDFWDQTGLVSETVYPYAFPSCEHHINGSKPPCGSVQPTPDCNQQLLKNPKNQGKTSYSVPASVEKIQTEIMTNGPVEVAFSVYADFLTYKSGVYHHTSGSMLGGHAVKMLGWGVDAGTPYWIVANSWNPDWGNQGYFLIRRGHDECGIESEVVAGKP